jgi:hypothetical protein
VMERYKRDFNVVMGLHPSLVKFCNDLEKEAKTAWTTVEDDSWEEEKGGS